MKRKGFTLVELLIVIVVIGILSAMMMMSSSEAVSSARASTITTNMRNLQTAALAYWADNMNKFNKSNPDKPLFEPTNEAKGVLNYLKDDENSKIDYSGYTLEVSNTGDTEGNWYIVYTFNAGRGDNSRVKEKVQGRAASLGLMKAMSEDVYDGIAEKLYVLVR